MKINLSKEEVKWIKLCKGHYDEKYSFPDKTSRIEKLKPLYEEIYGWSPYDHYYDFLSCMFDILFNIYMKIRNDGSGTDRELKEIIGASFSHFPYDYELPIERVIAKLCSVIAFNIVMLDGVDN